MNEIVSLWATDQGMLGDGHPNYVVMWPNKSLFLGQCGLDILPLVTLKIIKWYNLQVLSVQKYFLQFNHFPFHVRK